ncbi:hypothetical protein PUN28_017350 [Cardiocondyla obscurior]|uniref:Uncharacterized protein n=1 Tax=Cardiocondyla obscurior TaxID=286306 RepID=A0AAW2EQ51_9HYME
MENEIEAGRLNRINTPPAYSIEREGKKNRKMPRKARASERGSRDTRKRGRRRKKNRITETPSPCL